MARGDKAETSTHVPDALPLVFLLPSDRQLEMERANKTISLSAHVSRVSKPAGPEKRSDLARVIQGQKQG